MSGWLFLVQQTAASWSLLLGVGLCMGLRRTKLRRISLTALCCGGAALCCTHGLWRMLALALITLLAPFAAWSGVPRSRRPGMALCSLTLTILMAGCGRLLKSLGLSRTPLILAQCVLLPVLVRITPPASRAACILLEITHGARRLELTALVDSGNLLRDPITRLPVIVISRQTARRLVDSDLAGMRLISVRTVAGSALMPIFRPQQVQVLLPHGWQTVQAVIGLSPDGYSGFQALVPSCVISPSQGGVAICP